jgi:MraZ protein
MLGYTGNCTHTIDQKGRVNLPSKYRRMTRGKSYVISKGLEGCLFVFPRERWVQYLRSFMPKTFGKKSDRDFFRQLGFNTEEVELDDGGRLKIPPDFIDHAGIEKDVLVIGVIDHIEFWNPDRWTSYRNGIDKPYEQLAEEALGQVDPTAYFE